MSLLKKILPAVAVIVAVLLISSLAAYKLIDDKTIEDKALQALQEALQREVNVDGKFTLTRSLHPTLKTSGVRIASTDWDKGNHLLTADKLEFGVSLPNLLLGEITIENIVFDNAIITIKRDQQGRSNLEFGSSKTSSSDRSSSTPILFDVIDILITNLQVNYSDLQTENSFVYALESFEFHPKNKDIIQIKTSSSFDGQPVKISSEICRIRNLLKGHDCSIDAQIDTAPYSTQLRGTINVANQGKVDLSVNTKAEDISEFVLTQEYPLPNTKEVKLAVRLNGNFKQLKASNIDIKAAIENTSLSATGSIASINPLSDIKLNVETSGSEPAWLNNYQEYFPAERIHNFKISSIFEGDARTWNAHSIDAVVEIDESKLNATGNFQMSDNLPQLAINLDVSGKQPAWLNESQQAIAAEQIDEFSLKADISNPENLFRIENLDSTLAIKDTQSVAQGAILFDAEFQPSIDLTVSSKGNNLQNFEELIKQSLPASEKFSLETQLKFAGNHLGLTNLTLAIDNTHLTGDSDIELSSPPNVRANLISESLNIEHLLAAGHKEKAKEKADDSENKDAPKDTRLFSDEKIDLSWLKSAHTDISLLIKNLIYKKAILNDVKTKVVALDNKATIEIDSLKYLDSNLKANLLVDANKNIFSHSLYTEEFNLGQLLNDIDAGEKLQGKIDASIDINSFGTSSQELANNASGKITAVMTEGSLADAPIDLLASNLLVELMPGKAKQDHTKIECLFVQFSANEGVFNSDAILLNTENIVMTINGSIDLSKEKLNLLLIPKPKNIELFTLDSNIRVKGNLQDPSFSLDKGSVFKKLLKSAATIALGPAALAVPFANMGNKSDKCFSEIASTTTRAVEAQQEAERIAAEKRAAEEAEKAKQEEAIKDATVEPLEP